MSLPFRYPRGATIGLSCNIVSGDPTGWTASAFLRTVTKGQTELVGDEPIAAEFDVVFVPEDAPDPAHYLLSLDAAVSAAIVGDYFLVDLRLVDGDNVAYSQMVLIRFYNPATESL